MENREGLKIPLGARYDFPEFLTIQVKVNHFRKLRKNGCEIERPKAKTRICRAFIHIISMIDHGGQISNSHYIYVMHISAYFLEIPRKCSITNHNQLHFSGNSPTIQPETLPLGNARRMRCFPPRGSTTCWCLDFQTHRKRMERYKFTVWDILHTQHTRHVNTYWL